MNGGHAADRNVATIRHLLLNVLELVDHNAHPQMAAAAAYLLAGLNSRHHTATSESHGFDKSEDGTGPAFAAQFAGAGASGVGGDSASLPSNNPNIVHALPRDEKTNMDISLHHLSEGLGWLMTGGTSSKHLIAVNLRRASSIYWKRATLSLEQKRPGDCLQSAMLSLQCRAGAIFLLDQYNAQTTPAATGDASAASGALLPLSSSVFHTGTDADVFINVLELVGDTLCQLQVFCPEEIQRVAETARMWRRTVCDAAFMSVVHHASDSNREHEFHIADRDRWLDCWTSSCESRAQPDSEGTPRPDAIELGVCRGAHLFGEVWEGLQLPESLSESTVSVLDASVRVYERAKQDSGQPVDKCIVQKLGNAQNMLGTHYMDASSKIDTSSGNDSVCESDALWHQAYSLLSQAAQAFTSIGDNINSALVNCNLGKLMRVGYRSVLMQGRVNAAPSQRELQFHNKVKPSSVSMCGSIYREHHTFCGVAAG